MPLYNLAICFGPNLFDLEGADSLLAGATSKKSVSPSTTAELQMAGLRTELQNLKALIPTNSPQSLAQTFTNDTLNRNLVKSSRSSSLGSLHGRRSPSRNHDLDISLPAGAEAGAGAVHGTSDSDRSSVILECTLLMLQNYQNLFAVCQRNVCWYIFKDACVALVSHMSTV